MSDEAVLFPHGNLQFDSLPPTRVAAGGKFEATDCSASQPVGVPAVVTGIFNRLARVGGMLALGLATWTAGADAGCNCGGGSGGAVIGPALPPNFYDAGGHGMPLVGMAPEMAGPMMATPYVTPPTPEVGPPPGTLGQTYQRPSRPIPVDKHPRVSIVDVRASGATQVKVYGTNEFRTKDSIAGFQDRRNAAVWRFESEPLVPGVPHIYRVDAHYGDSIQQKYIRLVPGRIVTLDF